MRPLLRIALVSLALAIGGTGCQFLGGAAVGAGATGAGYEYQRKQALDRLDDDFRAGRLTRDEYLARKRELEKGSVIY